VAGSHPRAASILCVCAVSVSIVSCVYSIIIYVSVSLPGTDTATHTHTHTHTTLHTHIYTHTHHTHTHTHATHVCHVAFAYYNTRWTSRHCWCGRHTCAASAYHLPHTFYDTTHAPRAHTGSACCTPHCTPAGHTFAPLAHQRYTAYTVGCRPGMHRPSAIHTTHMYIRPLRAPSSRTNISPCHTLHCPHSSTHTGFRVVAAPPATHIACTDALPSAHCAVVDYRASRLWWTWFAYTLAVFCGACAKRHHLLPASPLPALTLFLPLGLRACRPGALHTHARLPAHTPFTAPRADSTLPGLPHSAHALTRGVSAHLRPIFRGQVLIAPARNHAPHHLQLMQRWRVEHRTLRGRARLV